MMRRPRGCSAKNSANMSQTALVRSRLADPGALDPDPGAVDTDPGAVDTDPGAVDSDPGAVDPDPGAVDSDPGPNLENDRLRVRTLDPI